MKPNLHVLGVDEGPFSWDDERVPVVGVVMRPEYIDGFIVRHAKVDGDDATDMLVSMVKGTRFGLTLNAVMVDGITIGGFNVVDLKAFHERTGVPILTVTRDRPEEKDIKDALAKHFKDWERRWALMSAYSTVPIKVGKGRATARDGKGKGRGKGEGVGGTIYANFVGMSLDEAKGLIRRFIVRGNLPEPVRIAHLMATAIVKGESGGKA